MFDKILIANRGEIACRIARTAQRMGIATVAVYSDADADALHVKSCDEAYHIGPSSAADSYLRSDILIDVARKSGAQAVHPGYGFLSESANFSRACENAGVVFIGPPESAITSMGSKSEAKRLMTQAGVPLVPGYHGDDQCIDTLKRESSNIGFPQLIKATAGGGGKGMRVVNSDRDFETALVACKREAKASFGDDKVLIERYLTAPRHIEFQIFADSHGNCVHIFERDCSVQRRHQKVIEEAPAPRMSERLREKMGKAAMDSALAINYVGAGTVEFLLDTDDSFYFMEMNTRLQVEHPISELISGQDLVEWQLRVATGEPLPLKQEDLNINGHAFEARIYAETPENDFLPSTGTLTYLNIPQCGTHVRVDTGVQQGDEVSIHYDPMIAKLIVWDTNRDNALRQMKAAVSRFQILGLNTNLEFLAKLFAVPAFADADIDTRFIEKYRALLFESKSGELNTPHHVVALSCLHELLRSHSEVQTRQTTSDDPYSPWGMTDGWILNQDSFCSIILQSDQTDVPVDVYYEEHCYRMEIEGSSLLIFGAMLDEFILSATINGRQVESVVTRKNNELTVLCEGKIWQLIVQNPYEDTSDSKADAGSLTAPMPGTVVSVEVNVGDTVEDGDVLMVVEAMKMEHSIKASQNGKVEEIFFLVGDQVEDGDTLLSLVE